MIHIIPILRDNYCYLIEGTDGECIIVDPGQVKPVEIYIDQKGLTPVAILNTHHHADHVAGNSELSKKYSIPVIGPSAEQNKIPSLTDGVSEGDRVSFAGIDLDVYETPGHTKGHIVFHWKDMNILLTGDTLFSMGCGRLLEGSADEMYESLQKIKSFSLNTMIYCGHEYTETNGRFALSEEPDNTNIQDRMDEVHKRRNNNLPTVPVALEIELKTNLFLKAGSLNEFAGLRARKDSF